MVLVVPVSAPSRIDFNEFNEISDAIQRVINSEIFVGGSFCEHFETDFSEYLGGGELITIGTASGQDALFLSMLALDLPADSIVIVPPNDGGYAALAVQSAGLKPLLIDVNHDGLIDADELLNLDSDLVRQVKGIVLTHLHGFTVNLELIVSWATQNNVRIIEDCAQAAGATYHNQKVGTFGDVACFSFYPTKNLGAFGDSGAVVTKSKSIEKKINKLKQYGWSEKYFISEAKGLNSRQDSLQAAILSARLNFLDSNNQKRNRIFNQYLSQLPRVNFLGRSKLDSVNHHVVLLTENRSYFRSKLKKFGIETEVHYPFLVDEMPGINSMSVGILKKARSIAARCVSIPCFPEMSTFEVNRVIESILEAS